MDGTWDRSPSRTVSFVGIGDVEVTAVIRSDAGRMEEPGRRSQSVGASAGPSNAGERAHGSGRGNDLSDGEVIGVGYVDIARSVHRHVDGESNRAALPMPSAPPELPASPASVLTNPVGRIFRMV